MKQRAKGWMVIAIVAGAAATWAAPPPARGERGAGAFVVETLAEGVHLYRPAAATGERLNSLVVERQDGLLVVDAQPNPEAARELLEAVASLGKPVRYLLLTHPHVESWGGASVFPDTTLVISSAGCRDALADPSYDAGAEARARAGSPDGWKEPRRIRPTLVLAAPAVLDDPHNAVEIYPVTSLPAHSRGDLLVWIPRVSVIAVGHLASLDRNPFVSDSNLGNWLNVLNSISLMTPARVVPLRGGTMEEIDLRRERDVFAWTRGQVDAAFIDLVPREGIPERVLASPDFGKYYDVSLVPSFARAVAEQAVREVVEYRKKRRLE